MAGYYFKFALCFVLFVSLECRVIKIVDDEDSNNDIVIKIILKHKKKEHKVKEDKKEVPDDTDEEKVAKLNEIIEKMKNEMENTHKDAKVDEVTNKTGEDNFVLSKNELPDNFNEQEELSDSISNNMIDKEEPQKTSEYVPKLNTRSGIQVGSCPSGFIRRGPLCLPADK